MNRRGLTLIELMIVVGILGIVVLMLNTVFKTGFDAWNKSEVRLEIYQNARVVLDQISRELPGAFVGGGAEFEGINANPDTIEFVTSFAGSLYQIQYVLDSTTNTLKRYYDENPVYSAISYTEVKFGSGVSDIQFLYLPLGSAGGWGSADEQNEWIGASITTLPEAVKVKIKLRDKENNEYPFETIIYLPNSE